MEEATRNAARYLVTCIIIEFLGRMARVPLIKLYREPFQTKISLLQESVRRTVEQMWRSFTFNRLIV